MLALLSSFGSSASETETTLRVLSYSLNPKAAEGDKYLYYDPSIEELVKWADLRAKGITTILNFSNTKLPKTSGYEIINVYPHICSLMAPMTSEERLGVGEFKYIIELIRTRDKVFICGLEQDVTAIMAIISTSVDNSLRDIISTSVDNSLRDIISRPDLSEDSGKMDVLHLNFVEAFTT
jgi:hypothetical protein